MSDEFDKVTVTIKGQTLEIDADAWAVLMRAFNILVDTGDIYHWADKSSRADIAEAQLASASLRLMEFGPHIAATQPDELE